MNIKLVKAWTLQEEDPEQCFGHIPYSKQSKRPECKSLSILMNGFNIVKNKTFR